MNYRIRNTRTEKTLTDTDTVRTALEEIAEPEKDAAEWVLEFEIAEGVWEPSGYHVRDILGVRDPRPLADIAAAFGRE